MGEGFLATLGLSFLETGDGWEALGEGVGAVGVAGVTWEGRRGGDINSYMDDKITIDIGMNATKKNDTNIDATNMDATNIDDTYMKKTNQRLVEDPYVCWIYLRRAS